MGMNLSSSFSSDFIIYNLPQKQPQSNVCHLLCMWLHCDGVMYVSFIGFPPSKVHGAFLSLRISAKYPLATIASWWRHHLWTDPVLLIFFLAVSGTVFTTFTLISQLQRLPAKPLSCAPSFVLYNPCSFLLSSPLPKERQSPTVQNPLCPRSYSLGVRLSQCRASTPCPPLT